MFRELKKSIQLGLAIKKVKNANEIEKEKAIVFLRELLAQESGIFAKFSQYLGTSKEWDKDLVYSNHNLINTSDIKTIFKESFNDEFDDVFSEIDQDPMKASIGQVHKVTLVDGTELALKVQYPGIRETIYDQLKLMNLFPLIEKVTPIKKWGIPVGEYQNLFKKLADEELNYTHEINNHKIFAINFKGDEVIKTSELFPKYQSPQLYLQSFIDGYSVKEVQEKFSFNDLEFLALKMFEAFIKQVFIHRFYQADTNHGNFIFSELNNCPVVYYIDFGSCIKLEKKFVLALGKLIKSVIYKDDTDPLQLLGDLGFDTTKLVHIQKQLPKVLECFFYPLLNDYPNSLDKWNLDEQLSEVLGEYKWWFRSSGGTQFFSIMKAFSGYKALFIQWGVQVCWKMTLLNLIKPMFNEFDNYIPSTQKLAESYSFSTMAKHLRIIVKDGDKEKVNLTMPASVCESLHEIIEQDILDKLNERSINLDEIIMDLKRNGGYPQDIFQLTEGTKDYYVFLE